MTTIAISINGEEIMITAPCSLNQALYVWSTMVANSSPDTANDGLKNGVQSHVIALNQTFVPRNQYGSTRLNSGDIIELLSPMAGG
ncbi:MAG: sulfur carrier protein ThiS [Oleispira antarctica]|uniref:Probable thiamine-biosynthesis, ThiS n=1 Tax=Oleispira antarctica RB-8 TaxID=698738 RepID=R4YU12_OLEAN|nr:sulfur carrier protein ThiS [Oleispira antarctica]MBQ0792361.1 sulfur carrier protein ThiS [Oleispira antarctica]CCK76294.1 probable thiamine-biosynthesis, ThiS [Oleispira antarctica RB-8]|tara:strand:- start:428 stop:685 length:258 start_codon:yes stop_codon:yes gene_type:complete